MTNHARDLLPRHTRNWKRNDRLERNLLVARGIRGIKAILGRKAAKKFEKEAEKLPDYYSVSNLVGELLRKRLAQIGKIAKKVSRLKASRRLARLCRQYMRLSSPRVYG